MMKEYLGWLALWFIASILIIGGFQGAIGCILACIVVPSQVVMNE